LQTVALIEASVQPGGRLPAPEPLELVQAFVNTVDREHGPDLLDEPAHLAAWAKSRGFDVPGDVEHVREVREALRALLWANNGASAEGLLGRGEVAGGGGGARGDVAGGAARVRGDGVRAAVATLDAAAAGLRARFDPPRLEGDGVVETVLGVVFLATADGSWARLKACPGERCGWAFYDRSVNASATWCSMRTCGNRAKTRSYYRRTR